MLWRRCFLGLLFASFFLLTSGLAAQTVPSSQSEILLSFSPVVKKAAPAVVNIYTRKRVRQRTSSLFNDPFFRQFFRGSLPQGPVRERMESSLGSGVIVEASGLVVTSNHVIEGADEINVVLGDKREFDAEIVSSDKKSDLAVLKIKTKGEKLPFLEIKDSDDVEVGDMVLAVGNPFGVGQTVTSGIVSAVARTSLDITDINYFIQTDAAINPGNSGGALVGMEGKLVGINSAIYSRFGGSIGLGFAVPSNMVRAIVQSALLGQKKLVRPWTGIKGQAVSNDLAASLGMKRPTGFLINGLHEASPARESGMKVGDVITHIQGRKIEGPAAFTYRVATLPIGGASAVRFLRDGKEKIQKMKLIVPPEVPARDVFLVKEKNFLQGAKVANLSPALAEEYNLSDNKGVVILDVQRSLMAGRLGLRKGDILVKINGDEIHLVKDIKRVVKKGFFYGRLVFKRGGKPMHIMIEKR